MAIKKLYDAAVKTRTYQDQRTGGPKAVWQNVGAIWTDDSTGNKWLTVSRWFNPAGVPFDDGRDTVSISLFAPKEKTGDGP